MHLRSLVRTRPSVEAWAALVAAVDARRPHPAEVDGLRRFLRRWPPWVRLFPATWFERVVRGEMRPWFALATDADVGAWAYSRASPGAYSHEMSPGYELESALEAFAASEAMGFVRRVRTCHEGGGVLLRHATHLYGVQLVDEARAGTLQTLLDAPWTPTLRELSLENRDRGVPSGVWPRLAARLRSVRVLRLGWVDIDGAFVRALLGEAGAQPEVLVLFPARGDGAVEALVEAPPPRLRELEIRGARLSTPCLERLVRTTELRSLRSLSLRTTRAGDGPARALADSPVLERLVQLDLRDNRLTDNGIAALVGSPKSARLRSLTLRGNRITDAGALAIAGSSHLVGLEHLNLRETRIGADGLRAIARSDRLSALRVINIMHTPGSKLVRAELGRRFERVIDVSVR